MFEYRADREAFAPGLFVLQLFAVPPLNLLLGFLILWGIDAQLSRKWPMRAFAYLLFSVQGFALGYVFQSLVPRAILGAGRRIWIAPVALLLSACLFDLTQFGWRHLIPYFWPGPMDIDGLVLLLLTLPTVAACFYSLGVVAAHRHSTRVSALPQPTTP